MDDYYSTVFKPRDGSAEAIAEMNAKMMIWHPALSDVRRNDRKVMYDAKEVLEGNYSIANMFQSIVEKGY